jgi:hypothetical protein
MRSTEEFAVCFDIVNLCNNELESSPACGALGVGGTFLRPLKNSNFPLKFDSQNSIRKACGKKTGALL